MGDFFNTTNTMISIIAGLFTILGPIIGVLRKRQSVLSANQYQQPQVQIRVRSQWSGFALVWRTWMGILLGAVFAVMFTFIPFFVVSGFISFFTAYQNGSMSSINPDFTNPLVFAICAIFGVSIGVTVAVGIASGSQKFYSS